jgi:hypothetical protein
MSFFTKIKSVFKPNNIPKYHIYNPSELKVIAMKTRILLEENNKKIMKNIQEVDRKFLKVGQDPKLLYEVFMEIGEKVI